MPGEGRATEEGTGQAAASPRVTHADGTLTLTGSAVEVEVTRGSGYRGTITVPRERCTLRVMGRAIAVFDSGRLVHLCSRCKPREQVARLVADLGDRVTLEPRTPFATLLSLREESAAYRPPAEERGQPAGGAGEAPSGKPQEPEDEEDEEAAREIPPGHESLRRVYLSQAAMERDSRRLRAAGWVAHQVLLTEEAPEEPDARRRSRLRGLLRATSPSRDVTEGVIVWVRPHAGEPPRIPPEG